MDLIQIAWPMMGGACVILGLIHLLLVFAIIVIAIRLLRGQRI